MTKATLVEEGGWGGHEEGKGRGDPKDGPLLWGRERETTREWGGRRPSHSNES